MKPFDAVHVSEPGLVVVEVAAGDRETALAAVADMSLWWVTSGPSEVMRVPGEPGVRVRTYAALRAPETGPLSDPPHTIPGWR